MKHTDNSMWRIRSERLRLCKIISLDFRSHMQWPYFCQHWLLISCDSSLIGENTNVLYKEKWITISFISIHSPQRVSKHSMCREGAHEDSEAIHHLKKHMETQISIAHFKLGYNWRNYGGEIHGSKRMNW